METALIERLENLTEPDREADAWIGYATNLVHDDMSWREKIDRFGIEHAMKAVTSYSNIWREALPRYTGSIDAATSLAEHLGFDCSVVTGPPSARVWSAPWAKHDVDPGPIVEAATPAIALCIAAVKAAPSIPPTPR